MKKNITIAIRLTLVCLIFFCGIYTLALWGIAQASSGNGNGLTITGNGKRYHVNAGQSFASDKYFWSRPSAVDYDGAGSGGSNKGPANAEYLAEVQARIDTFLAHHPTVKKSDIPSDLVTASGSGLDPHFSAQAAKVQVERISRIRNISVEKLNKLIDDNTERPLFGLFGTERINVLKLNLGLDALE
jgi:K+-transporting ATPase ATPase C chain